MLALGTFLVVLAWEAYKTVRKHKKAESPMAA
jgi:hypothetical protein